MNNPDKLKDFQTREKKFLITGCKEIQKRYDFFDPLLPLLLCVIDVGRELKTE